LQNVVKAMNLSGIELEDLVFSGLAAFQCLMSDDTKEQGIALIEIDDNFTTLSVFYDNVLRGVCVEQKSVIALNVLERLKGEMNRIRDGRPISKIILLGSSYVHEDFIDNVNTVFGIPSHAAYIKNIRGKSKDITNPTYLTSIGASLYGFDARARAYGHRELRFGLIRKATRRVEEFIDEYF
ncbi:MAG: hypothetical protein JW800_02000, partial [Candidatus Omnitrophica bacterium]|nr:hypothetical protein [Candidatus Omnitrophota bacterium]